MTLFFGLLTVVITGIDIIAGLQIGHFEKNSRRKKLKTQGKNSITQG